MSSSLCSPCSEFRFDTIHGNGIMSFKWHLNEWLYRVCQRLLETRYLLYWISVTRLNHSNCDQSSPNVLNKDSIFSWIYGRVYNLVCIFILDIWSLVWHWSFIILFLFCCQINVWEFTWVYINKIWHIPCLTVYINPPYRKNTYRKTHA